MLWCSVYISCVVAHVVIAGNFGPAYPPTSGEVWPAPQQQNKTENTYIFNALEFKIIMTNRKCDLLRKAKARYEAVFNDMEKIRKRFGGGIKTLDDNEITFDLPPVDLLRINVTGECDSYPQFYMDEKYTLRVSRQSQLTSATVWGAIRGLETFSQLLYFSNFYEDVLINGTYIEDFPRYPHRGLMIDTGRHYLRVESILRTLDAMAMNKMNVLHWHIVDDQSFPYQSEKFPELSAFGAYHTSLVYNQNNIQEIIDYAAERGIRVVPEFHMPGHTRSLGEAHADLLAACGDWEWGPINPIQNSTFTFLRNLFQEVKELFLDNYIHIGGTEDGLECWEYNAHILRYMKQNHYDLHEMYAVFINNVSRLLPDGSQMIVWEETFNGGLLNLPRGTTVQIWKTGFENINADKNYYGYNRIEDDEIIKKMLVNEKLSKWINNEYKIVYSTPWQLNPSANATFSAMYAADARYVEHSTRASTNRVVGGETCAWGDAINDNNIISSVWPRTIAMAEVLWSDRNYNDPVPQPPYRRAEEQACRMIRRGLPVAPVVGPSFCIH